MNDLLAGRALRTFITSIKLKIAGRALRAFITSPKVKLVAKTNTFPFYYKKKKKKISSSLREFVNLENILRQKKRKVTPIR